jgi:hypothetical protein
VDNVTKIKAELFDIVAVQERLRQQFAHLEQAKAAKLAELREAQQLAEADAGAAKNLAQ